MAFRLLPRPIGARGPTYVCALVMLWPCIALGQQGVPSASTCQAAAARFSVGQPYTPDLAERARQAAQARAVRKIEPGGAYTMDFSPDRLNVEVDRAGIVRELNCG